MSLRSLPPRIASVGWSTLVGLTAAVLPIPYLARAQTPTPAPSKTCPCSCDQPSLGLIGPDGQCQCFCRALPIPGINAETLSGPPKPPRAGGPAPTWTVEPGFEDGFAGPFWDDWW